MTKKQSTSVEIISPKRVAADGTQRGLHRLGKKSRLTELIENCQAAVELDTGIKNWDPVVMLAVISGRAFSGYPDVDKDGNPILDEDGHPIMIPPDPALAAATAAKAAPFLHQHLKPKEADVEETETSPDEIRERVLTAFENMGVKINRKT